MPSLDSFAVQVFNDIRYDLLPPDVQLVVTNPMSAFISQVWLAIFLAFLLTLPLFIYKIVLYIRPALMPHEKKILLWIILPIALLFLSGAAYSYFFLVPITFKVLYPYATVIGAVSLFSVEEFIYYISGLMVAVGFMFLLPLLMILLSTARIIEVDFWKRGWRHAFVFFLVLSAIITPDGTGVTMILLFLPLAGLYLAGYFFANRLSRYV